TTISSWKAWTQNEFACAGHQTECTTLGPGRPDRHCHCCGASHLAASRRADCHVRMRHHKIMVGFAEIGEFAAYCRLVYAVAYHPWLSFLLAVHGYRAQSPARLETCGCGRHRSGMGTGRKLEF